MITVRYFAAAAEAAGRDTEVLDATTLAALRDDVVGRHGAELERVLRRCSFLVAGARAEDGGTPLPDGVTVDVLPPFAGG
ncbi:molybdopterin converting factor [Actinotalea ferrariae CF5-4]|uniref:Molybdopterin converting factor n=1 Tax=Actinotalea ferrariae CF5-4 TaxID=948458 RepID=A0A021VLE4_9CELL|nr:MoaD/ThiS family protein [Actinotalea ferrariae]EYR61903.1 molybdopterin converting factor [Actinotalea ferrariae CF5-4]